MSFHLTTCDPDDSKPWDFNDHAKQVKAERLVRQKKSLLLIGSPMCTAFSQLQNLNFAKMTEEQDQVVKDYGYKPLEFMMRLYNIQVSNGLEHFASEVGWGSVGGSDTITESQASSTFQLENLMQCQQKSTSSIWAYSLAPGIRRAEAQGFRRTEVNNYWFGPHCERHIFTGYLDPHLDSGKHQRCKAWNVRLVACCLSGRPSRAVRNFAWCAVAKLHINIYIHKDTRGWLQGSNTITAILTLGALAYAAAKCHQVHFRLRLRLLYFRFRVLAFRLLLRLHLLRWPCSSALRKHLHRKLYMLPKQTYWEAAGCTVHSPTTSGASSVSRAAINDSQAYASQSVSAPKDVRYCQPSEVDEAQRGTSLVPPPLSPVKDAVTGNQAPASQSVSDPRHSPCWHRYAVDETKNIVWWNCDTDGGSAFVESDPDWCKYLDPVACKTYWWHSDEEWFYEHSGNSSL